MEFGFTDLKIFDCGDAKRCAAHSLAAEGGNNDAAALFHAAQIARMSRRSAKLLVMISDGAPTECTTTALRLLVERLTRERFCCAQVALHRLEEVCFPNYILLEKENLGESVGRFGTTVVKLVRHALQNCK